MVKVIRESANMQKANKKSEQGQERNFFKLQDNKKTVTANFTKADIEAISRGKSLFKGMDHNKYMHYSNADVMTELLKQHNEVDELYLSDTSGVITKTEVNLSKSLHKELSKAASKAGVELRDYVRGIIYSRSKQLREEKHNQYLSQQEQKNNNRIVRVNLFLDKETRESIYKTHGKMNDEELSKLVQRESLKHLSK